MRSDDTSCPPGSAPARSTLASRMVKVDEPIWVPRSQVHEGSDVWDVDHEGELVVSGWWARAKGLD